MLMSVKRKTTSKILNNFDFYLLALILAGIILTYSKGSYITSLIIITIFVLCRWVNIKKLLIGFGGAVILILMSSINFKAIFLLLVYFIQNNFSLVEYLPIENMFEINTNTKLFFKDEANRWESIMSGIELFFANPIFGAGLGAFMKAQLMEKSIPFVIHSTPIWIAAEFGIIGLVVMALTIAVILRTFRTIHFNKKKTIFPLAIGCMISYAIMSIPHDMFNQRIFWLILGALMAKVSTKFIHLTKLKI